jgi:hypothetical protein
MTSNVGAREMAQRALVFSEHGEGAPRIPKDTDADRAVERLFSPSPPASTSPKKASTPPSEPAPWAA